MGHGVKTVDTKATRIWFCTAGYLVLLAAHHPEVFKDHTHLVIDEIHEEVSTQIYYAILQKT